MDKYQVIKYKPDCYEEWNHFIEDAKNATFLFHRDFMEYHAERFEDFSLMVYKKDRLLALLPANKLGNDIYSHQGLTYGGLVLYEFIKFEVVADIFLEILKYLKANKLQNLVLKQIPSIYLGCFTDEIDYLLFILKAELIKKDTLSVIALNNKLKISSNRLEGYKRGVKHDLVVKEEDNFELFWNDILIKNLKHKHNAKPVHSLKEIILLKKYFPKNIRQFNVYKKDTIVAGTTIFESKYVAHSQYISADSNKNELGSLDFLHHHLITDVFKSKRYFDFGISNENNGINVNKGLQFWKEGFGARTVTQDFYKVDVGSYKLLEKLFV